MEDIKKFFQRYSIEVFVKYFDVFEANKNERLNEEIFKNFNDNDEPWTKKSYGTRASKGKLVFRKEKEVDALDYIINYADKIDDKILNEAKRIRTRYPEIAHIKTNNNRPILSVEEKREDDFNINKREITHEEKKILVKYRLGQSEYRKKLIEYWKGCSVCGYEHTDILIASHIKPWSESDDEEKYDIFNGLLLTPNYDKLFDEYLISFDELGNILISDSLSDDDLKKLGISRQDKISSDKLTLRHVYYLEDHKHRFLELTSFHDQLNT